jgi:hypothetical protein
LNDTFAKNAMWKYSAAGWISPKVAIKDAGAKNKIVDFCFVYKHNDTYTTTMTDDESSSDVRRWFAEAVRDLWPVATGSLSLRKGPCIRKNCPACAAGRGHSSHALYVRRGSRRISIYVPERLVPEIRKAIENGRLLQDLINEAGVRYVSALKNESR